MTTKLTGLILIVDDTPANLDAISTVLSDVGYEIAIATSGEKALQLLQRRSPDLILLDVRMPGIDGFETCDRIKANPKICDIPIVFMTSLIDINNKIKGWLSSHPGVKCSLGYILPQDAHYGLSSQLSSGFRKCHSFYML